MKKPSPPKDASLTLSKRTFQRRSTTSKPLLTERDGRELAIAMIRRGREIGADAASIEAAHRDDAPQSNFVVDYLRMLREANNPQLDAGFGAVLSDLIASEGFMDAEFYENLEEAKM